MGGDEAPAGAKAPAAAATIAAAATWPDFSDGNLGPDSKDDNLGPHGAHGGPRGPMGAQGGPNFSENPPKYPPFRLTGTLPYKTHKGMVT